MQEDKKRVALTAFGKAVKCRLIDIERTQQWLQEQVHKKTGLFVDSGYLHKILTGQRTAPKVKAAIFEILDIDQNTMKGE